MSWVTGRSGSLTGLACALLLLLGRWSPARFLGFGVFPPAYLDLRVYLIAFCLILMLLPGKRFTLTIDFIAVSALISGFAIYALTALSTYSGEHEIINLRPFDYIAIKTFDVMCIIVLLLIFYMLSQSPRFEDNLWRWVFRISLVLTALGILATLQGAITYEQRLTVLGAAGGNFFSRAVGVATVLGAHRWARGDRPAWFFLAVMVAALIVVVLSGSRGGTVATAVALIVVLLLSFRPRKMLFLAVSGLGIFTILSILLPPTTLDFLTTRYIDQLAGKLYLARRDIVFEQALALWHENVLVGNGLGSFSQISAWEYPHNLFLELLCEFGILGTTIIMAPWLVLVVASLRRWRHLDQRSLAIFVLFFIAAQVSGDLYDSRAVFLLPVIMAGGALARQGYATATEHPPSPRAVRTPPINQAARLSDE